jgi:hypothetical protein
VSPSVNKSQSISKSKSKSKSIAKKANAVGMIVFKNPLYVVGACLSAWTHRQFIRKLGLNIQLIVMVDDVIYQYKDELSKYFDRVELIQMREMKLNPDYKVIHKYSEWMKNSVTKWEILQYDEYAKILFIDVDILPIKPEFYNVFKMDTPGIVVKGMNEQQNQVIPPETFLNNISVDPSEYYNLSLKLKNSLDAGFVLFTPDKTLYDEYFKFLKVCEGTAGYISSYHSSVDETTLLLFFVVYKQMPVHHIPYDYAAIPWEKFAYNKANVKGVNFLSMVKPWVKVPMIQWADENIWHDIARKAFVHNTVLQRLHAKYLIEYLYTFYHTWKKNIHKGNSPYNMECVKSNKLKYKTFRLFDYLKRVHQERLSPQQINYILAENAKIHAEMNKKLLISFTELDKL